MRNKIITEMHYDYANELVKTIELFKKLFPLDSFDLRKINYSFLNLKKIDILNI